MGEGLQHRPEAQVGEVVVNQTQRHAVNPAQGAQMNDGFAFGDAKGFGNVAAGRAQHRQQFLAGRVAALFQQILAKTRLGVERVVDGAHQYQYADALAALDPSAFHQLIDGAA